MDQTQAHPGQADGKADYGSIHSSAAALVKGSLVSIKFEGDNAGKGIASQIAILATPGSAFVFSGNVSFLDMHYNQLVVVDPRDNQSYKISFDPARFPLSRNLHEGAHVTVNASFDGSRYIANSLKAN